MLSLMADAVNALSLRLLASDSVENFSLVMADGKDCIVSLKRRNLSKQVTLRISDGNLVSVSNIELICSSFMGKSQHFRLIFTNIFIFCSL